MRPTDINKNGHNYQVFGLDTNCLAQYPDFYTKCFHWKG